MKLYTVTTIVKEYAGCRSVPFIWFRHRPEKPKRPYAELIENYKGEGDHAYAEHHVEELFTAGEAKQLKDYLDREHGAEGPTTIEEVRLPVPGNTMAVCARPVGGGDDFYRLCEEPEYSLPFKVWGYLDLVGCELLDGSGVFHHRLLLFSAGEVRWQTNQEAGGGPC